MTQLKRRIVFFLTALLAVLVGCAPTPTREGTGEYFDDTVITTKVKTASSQAAISKAVEVTNGVKGVKSVKNDMLVKAQ